jgi:ATP synthase protein I
MKGWKSFGKYGSVGIELFLSIAIGYYGGRWLDGRFGTHWIQVVGFVVGCYAGFRGLYKAAKQMQRDVENDEKLARGIDPWADPKPKDDDSETDTSAASGEKKDEKDGR